MLHNTDLNKLKIFAAVFEFRGVTTAAEKLSVTPSAISQSLGQLERELGFKLFQRISKKLVPTSHGQRLYDVFEKSMRQIEHCLGEIHSHRDELQGLLKIGAPPEFGSRQVVRAAETFFKHPHSRFEIQFALPDDLLRQLINHEIDLAFCDFGPYLKKYSKLIECRTVFREEAVLVCSNEFFKGHVKGITTFQHLSTLPHCDYRRDGKVLDLWYQHHFGKKPKTYDLRLVAEQVNAMIEAALGGMGLVFIPAHLIQAELKSKKLIPIPGKKSEYVNPIVLVQLADKVPTPLEKAFSSHFGNGSP